MKRVLGRSEIEVSAVGLGCWAIAGAYTHGGRHVGWGETDDPESIRAIHRALDLGVTLFDTAACYGAGHSETLLGQALAGHRDEVVIATKFGHLFDPKARATLDDDWSRANLIRSCEGSLRRLRTDRLDVLQFHCSGAEIDVVDDLLEGLEELVAEGKVRGYGWSTDDPDKALAFTAGAHCTVVQQQYNILEGSLETLLVAEQHGLASLNRGPLAKGVLTGKFKRGDALPANDVRHRWNTNAGDLGRAIDVVDVLRSILTEDGRTPAQGALGWLLATSQITVPIPGFKTVAQVEDNAGALLRGPLTLDQMERITACLTATGWERCRFA